MRRETQNIVLGLVGGALLKIALDGTFLRYVKPTSQPWLICAGVIMIVLAGAAIIRDIRAKNAQHAEHEAQHQHGKGRVVWLLVLPVFAVFLIAPPALGADSVLRSAAVQPAANQSVVKTDFPPLPAGSPLTMRLTDLVTRASWDATNSLDGRVVQLTGFIVRQGNAVYLARLVITCCAADAMPVKIALTGFDLSATHDDQWVSVTGQIRPDSANQQNNYVPTFTVSELTSVKAPKDPYEY